MISDNSDNRGRRSSTNNTNNNTSQTINSFCFAISLATCIVSFGRMLTDHYFLITVTLLSMLVVSLHFYRIKISVSSTACKKNLHTALTTSKSLIHTPRNKSSPFNRRTVRMKRVCILQKERTTSLLQ